MKNESLIKTRRHIKAAGDTSLISAIWSVLVLLLINIISGTEPGAVLSGTIGLCVIAAPFVWMSLRLACRENKPNTTTGFLIALLIFNLLTAITLVPIAGVVYCICALARKDLYAEWYNGGRKDNTAVSSDIFSAGSIIICIAAAIAMFFIGILSGTRLVDNSTNEANTYNSGYANGISDGRSAGYTSGKSDGYSEGYNGGFSDGIYCAAWIEQGGSINDYPACEPLR